MKRIVLLFLLSSAFLLSGLPEANAQCPMCRMSAESNLKEGGTEGKGLNKGILFLLATPYVLVGLVGLAWYRSYQKKQGEEESPAEL